MLLQGLYNHCIIEIILITLMAGTISIELHQLRFFAAHGVYAEESKLENEFEVNLQLTYSAPPNIITKIDEIINYVAVYTIVMHEIN